MIQVLVEVRERLRLTQVEFAKRIKVAPSYISKLEAGSVPMTDRMARKYAEVSRRPRKHFENLIPEEAR